MSLVLLGILNSQVSGAGAGAYDLLETQVLTSSASSVTFTGLGSYTDYKHLQIRGVLQNAGTAVNLQHEKIIFNSDTGTNYAYHELGGNGSSVVSNATSSTDRLLMRQISCSDAGGSQYGAFVLDVLDFSNASKNTTVRYFGGLPATNEKFVILGSGVWVNTNAVTSIEIVNYSSLDYQAGSRISLYGGK